MKKITTKRLVLLALFIALQIVLSKLLRIQLTPSVRLSFDSVPILLAGIWFGPIAGGIVGAMGDFLGTMIFDAWYPLLTVSFFLIGFVSGLLSLIVKNKHPLLRMAFIIIPAELIGSYFFKSFALSLLLGKYFTGLLALRALPVLAVMLIDIMFVTLLDNKLHQKVLSESKLPEHNPIKQSEDLPESMSYESALAYIHQVAWRGSRLGLERTNELLERIGNPHRKLRFIHVAGTNGKGSVCAMFAKILTLAGYRTGLYTSPYISSFNERMQMDGAYIADDELARITAFVKPHADAMADHPTEFELITVIAFEYFHRCAAQIVVLEVGLGGELDSTNVIDTPELSVITNIGLDHTRELGPTVGDISKAKAGIIKQGGDVVVYDRNPEADAVFRRIAAERGANLYAADHNRISNIHMSLEFLRFRFEPYGDLACGLIGAYQAGNAALAITAIERLQAKGWRISERNLRDGLALVRWPGRFELLSRKPVFIADGGHNPQGVSAAVDSLKALFPDRRITFLFGVMADKDIPRMIDQLAPLAKEFVTVQPDNPRALRAADLAQMLQGRGFHATPLGSVREGVLHAIELAGTDGIVCALGSLYMIGEIRAALGAS